MLFDHGRKPDHFSLAHAGLLSQGLGFGSGKPGVVYLPELLGRWPGGRRAFTGIIGEENAIVFLPLPGLLEDNVHTDMIANML